MYLSKTIRGSWQVAQFGWSFVLDDICQQAIFVILICQIRCYNQISYSNVDSEASLTLE